MIFTLFLSGDQPTKPRKRSRTSREQRRPRVADITTPLSEGREEDLFAHCEGTIISQANKEVTLLESGCLNRFCIFIY